MTTVVEPPESRFVPRKRTPLTVDFDMDYNGGADGFVYGNDATVQRLSLLVADDLGNDNAIDSLKNPQSNLPPMAGALLKNENDVSLLERLGFMLRLNR